MIEWLGAHWLTIVINLVIAVFGFVVGFAIGRHDRDV